MMMTQTIAVERVDHIGVRVHDLDRALAFYRVLGFDLVRRPENDDVGKEEAQTRLGPGFESLSLSGESYAGPLRWNERAQAEGTPRRVFCASMADVFDNKVPTPWRVDLWSVIRSTPALDWFLLTKRPQNIRGMLPTDWGEGWPNVWPGTTTENQEEANRLIPHLVAIPAAVRFLSVEPMF